MENLFDRTFKSFSKLPNNFGVKNFWKEGDDDEKNDATFNENMQYFSLLMLYNLAYVSFMKNFLVDLAYFKFLYTGVVLSLNIWILLKNVSFLMES